VRGFYQGICLLGFSAQECFILDVGSLLQGSPKFAASQQN